MFERAIRVALWLSALVVLGALLSILAHILKEGLPIISLDFILREPRSMGREGGILPTIISTIYLTGVAIAIATPIGVGSAIYFNEYAHDTWFTRAMRFGTETLSGVPSIIFGLFGFTFFVIWAGLGWSIISGALTLALMILPTITRTTEESLKAVPRAYREGSLSLGATTWETILRVILPAASPGIVTGIILGMGRAIGETAAVLLTAGSSLRAPIFLTDPARTMSIHLYILATEGISMANAYGTAAILVISVLLINIAADIIRRQLLARIF
jgi:phosphate transport system permease protein